MKFLFASDSFKGSLSCRETIDLLTKAAKEVFGDLECVGVPVADGGEGTREALLEACSGRLISCMVQDPLGRPIEAAYADLNGGSALIEMAAASGLPLLSPEERNPEKTSTFGTGQLILDAIARGFTEITVAIGGSATNDGGMGCARALGVKFLDADGKELAGCGEELEKVSAINLDGLHPGLQQVHLQVICDVRNPLCGPEGATRTFGAQKGADAGMLERLEAGMENYRRVIRDTVGTDPNTLPGSGAAGGLATALALLMQARLRPGIDTVLDLIGFDEKLRGVDLVVTGEGCTDWQSRYGKVMQGVVSRAKAQGIPVVGLSGSLGKGAEEIYEDGVVSLMSTVNGPMPLQEAMDRAEELYFRGAVRMFRFLQVGMRMQEDESNNRTVLD